MTLLAEQHSLGLRLEALVRLLLENGADIEHRTFVATLHFPWLQLKDVPQFWRFCFRTGLRLIALIVKEEPQLRGLQGMATRLRHFSCMSGGPRLFAKDKYNLEPLFHAVAGRDAGTVTSNRSIRLQ
jgi:hypothetical protein